MQRRRAVDAGAPQFDSRAAVKLSTCRISVVERSGYSLLPNAKRSSAGRFWDRRSARNWRIDGSATTGALVWNFSHLATSDVADIRESSQIGVS